MMRFFPVFSAIRKTIFFDFFRKLYFSESKQYTGHYGDVSLFTARALETDQGAQYTSPGLPWSSTKDRFLTVSGGKKFLTVDMQSEQHTRRPRQATPAC